MEPCVSGQRIDALEKRDDKIFDMLGAMENRFDGKLDLILMQINKIGVLEANHTNHAASMSRVFEKISEIEKLVALQSKFQHTIEGMARMAWIIWTGMGITIIGIVAKMVFHS